MSNTNPIYITDGTVVWELEDTRKLGGDTFIKLTQAEFDALPEEEQMHGKYCITDAKHGVSSGSGGGLPDDIHVVVVDEENEPSVEEDNISVAGILLVTQSEYDALESKRGSYVVKCDDGVNRLYVDGEELLPNSSDADKVICDDGTSVQETLNNVTFNLSSIHPNSYAVIKDITNDWYNGTLRAEIASGNFSNVHPGNYIIGKVTGTKYWVVELDYWYNNRTSGYGKEGYAESTHHLAIMPQQLIGVSSLLWSGVTYSGSGANNTVQGCVPWNTSNTTANGYKASYIATTALTAVYNNWLSKDFDTVLSFTNLITNAINTSASCKGYSAYTGAASNWEWIDSKATLPSIQNITGTDGFTSSAFDVGIQKEQLAFFRLLGYQALLEDIPNTQYNRITWTKNIASSTYACSVSRNGNSDRNNASFAVGLRPLAFIS